jgi:hypothetical protein
MKKPRYKISDTLLFDAVHEANAQAQGSLYGILKDMYTPKDEVKCLCGHTCKRGDLQQSEDVDKNHPANKDLHANQPDLTKSIYEHCPRCTRVIYQDGVKLQPVNN